jgi:hypothetical protein
VRASGRSGGNTGVRTGEVGGVWNTGDAGAERASKPGGQDGERVRTTVSGDSCSWWRRRLPLVGDGAGALESSVRAPFEADESGSTEVGEDGEPGEEGGVLAARERRRDAAGEALRAALRPRREGRAALAVSPSSPSIMISSSTSLESSAAVCIGCKGTAAGEST